MAKIYIHFITFCIGIFTQATAQNIYFPPINNNTTWQTTDPASLGWCTDKIDALYSFLAQENTKSFIVLKDGKIVLEKYFGTFTQDSIWYWASAGKSMTSFLVGQAQEAGFLKITEPTSQYLGKGWTNCTPSQEDNITISHQLTMTTGLDDAVLENDCTLKSCLTYKADAGTRWAYHNAPYTMLEKVVSVASGLNYNTFTQQKLKNRIGMTGLWVSLDYNNVYFSNARSMAKYGVLIQNGGIWANDTLLKDRTFMNQMVNTSQSLNLSYGYLWWLNGKQSYMIPTLQTKIPGSYAPLAPSDMYSALGKNGQILSISPSKGIVIVRMGEKPNSPAAEIATLLCNQIWDKLNDVMCLSSSVGELSQNTSILIYPNPTEGQLYFNTGNNKISKYILFDMVGRICKMGFDVDPSIDLSTLGRGTYMMQLITKEGIFSTKKIVKI